MKTKMYFKWWFVRTISKGSGKYFPLGGSEMFFLEVEY